jgi:hypothetical protein
MTHVWICQCLCPQRHCILATAGEVDDGETGFPEKSQTTLRSAIGDMIAAKAINPWCGLCHATRDTWTYEARRTRYRTMQEAQPEFKRLEAEQAAVAALFGDMKRND